MKFPQVFDFLASSIQEESVEVRDIIKLKVAPLYYQGTKKIYGNIDYSKFREKGIQQMSTFENVTKFGEHYLKEWKSYSEILKNSFYK